MTQFLTLYIEKLFEFNPLPFCLCFRHYLEARSVADIRPPGVKLLNIVIHRFGGYALNMAVLLDVGPCCKLGRIHEGLNPWNSARQSHCQGQPKEADNRAGIPAS
jgi:hypothetical protein